MRAGCDAHAPSFRVYLAGGICLESAGQIVGGRQLPGPLGRHLLAMLAAEHNRPIGNDELAEEIWHGAPPPAWATSLKAFVSRTRAVITAAGMDGGSLIVGARGVYRSPYHSSGRPRRTPSQRSDSGRPRIADQSNGNCQRGQPRSKPGS